MKNRLRFVVNHDYGDKTIDYVMDIMDQLMEDEPEVFTKEYFREMRLTADHCGFYPRPEQLPRMQDLGMIISCAGRISPMSSMLRSGVMGVAEGEFGAEGGERETALAQFYPRISRKTTDGITVASGEAINRNQVIKAATTWPSFYILKEDDLGSLETGKLADFIVMNKDYFSVPEAEIPSVYPLMTVVGGKTVVLREEFGSEIGMTAVGPQMIFHSELDWRRGGE